MNVTQKWLPIEAIFWFKQQLENWIEDSMDRVADYLNSTHDIENRDEDIVTLASIIVNMNNKIVEGMALQLNHWSRLKLTDLQQRVVQDCKTEMLKLYQVQRLLEHEHPIFTGEFHLQSMELQ